MSKEGQDAGYEASRIQTFISKLKRQTIKKIKQKVKRTRRQNRKIGRLNQSIKSKWLFKLQKHVYVL